VESNAYAIAVFLSGDWVLSQKKQSVATIATKKPHSES